MTRSSARGARTWGDPEVLGFTPHALWLLVGGRELMLDYARFPWFARASIEDVCDVVLLHGHHLHWPRLDVDLHLDSVVDPDRFRSSRGSAAQARGPRAIAPPVDAAADILDVRVEASEVASVATRCARRLALFARATAWPRDGRRRRPRSMSISI